MTFNEWGNLLLKIVAIVVAIGFTAVMIWAAVQVKGILQQLARYDRARAELSLEPFNASDTEFVSKFNRNFHRIRLVMGGVRTIEHFWSVPGSLVHPDPQRLNGKCHRCGITMSKFYGADRFEGCRDEE